ncbi:RDD family protein [Shewanella eurypsychrophilus]|uniref:RDD family protein n=1 Tax=Shewanella eurypsychrophilus TaxID=2593656 RepID=A0ABX6V0H9_9GAMM|nr:MULTISPECIES: RDD family protein [Shewanella]QFU20556.1 RDD family protein [Shewanella sp. YLB-09]QFU20837.1 RDD family protein [Shewanella sp. YLB-09]QPG56125.1 RDD family protein [Shewanella eurypsychrophilus]
MDSQRYAGFRIRLVAAVIDLLIMVPAVFIPLSLIYGGDYWEGDQIIYGFWDLFLGYILPFVVTIFFWLRYLGTPGKMFTKLRVVDAETGNKLTLAQALGRYFGYILAMLPCFIGLIWIGLDEKKQGWHDKLANTVVVRG